MQPSSQNRCSPPADRDKRGVSFAHEISSPAESLLNLIFLMEREVELTPEAKRYLGLIRDETNRLSQIAHSALREFRYGSEVSATNVPELLASVLAFYRSRLESHGISVTTRYCTDGNMTVYPGPLRQTFANLLLNAVDSMPEGGTVHARVSNCHEWSGLRRKGLRVTFADSGKGIDSTVMSNILEPFFTTKGAAGNGIGLSLVNDTVLKHHGVLRIRSSTRTGHSGSIFTIFLPTN